MFRPSALPMLRCLLLRALLLVLFLFSGVLPATAQAALPSPPRKAPQQTITLRCAFGVPDDAGNGPEFFTQLQVLDAFQRHYPYVNTTSSSGLTIPNQADTATMMQIAGNIPPDVMRVNFRQSDTYILNRFLYPLDKYLEAELGLNIPDGDLLPNDQYLAKLKTSPRYAALDLDDRIPRQLWPVIRRECPYGENCPHLQQWHAKPAAHHFHIWCFPQGVMVMALAYSKQLFNEAGIEDRVPKDMDELYDWAKKLTNPDEDRYGLALSGNGDPGTLGWSTLCFLYSCGGRVVEQDQNGQWRCCFDSEESVNAYYFVSRLFNEPFDRTINGQKKTFTRVVGEPHPGAIVREAMRFTYLDDRFFGMNDPEATGFGPVPADSHGHRGNELNSVMTGIYAGLENDPARRDAAWKYIFFYESPEARRIRADVYVENGAGRYLSSKLLRQAGYPEFIRQIPAGWEDSRAQAIATGVPEPYGRNCQNAYRFLSQAIDQIRVDDEVTAAVRAKDETRAKNRIRQILHQRVLMSNEQMLNIITPQQRSTRNTVATIVAIAILFAFVFLFYRVGTAFARNQFPAVSRAATDSAPGSAVFPQRLFLRWFAFVGLVSHADPQPLHRDLPLKPRPRGHWQFDRHKFAYLLLLPALGSIALWAYYPLIEGTFIAFQNYNVRGFSTWVGMDNFANVLFDRDFWYAMWVSVKYAALYIAFGFFTPIILAFLLTEIPRGKVLFRSLFFLPAVLSGAVLMFLWKGFYSPYGLLNQIFNFCFHVLNHFPRIAIPDTHTAWLENPHVALFFCLLPTIWAGMGPGCLIYLAALKTVPEELYEAAEIDGAGIFHKLRHIAIPGIRGLVAINFIGALIGTIHGGGEMILAMTGGGPYTPYGASEVVGLHIYWQGFAYLRFGAATAMAWVLGALLIGFTVMRLSKFTKMEFKSANAMPARGGA